MLSSIAYIGRLLLSLQEWYTMPIQVTERYDLMKIKWSESTIQN